MIRWDRVAKRTFLGINQFRLVPRRVMSTHEARHLLGVSEKSTKKEIKNAYLAKVKIYHPDNQVCRLI